MASLKTDSGRLDHQMEDGPSRTHPHAAADRPADDHTDDDRAPVIHPPQEAPALSSAHFGSGLESERLTATIANWMQRGRRIWRGHLERDQLPEAAGGSVGNIERWLLALLSVLVIVSCVCAIIVFTQVTSLKAEIATLQREIIALKLRVARLDQIVGANDKPSGEAPKPPAENRADQSALMLSREELQLIRDYIKPAPVAGSLTETIKVGDPVTGETVPFPSPITDKVRKLLGARFTIRNGVIVITRNGSNRADVVIGPN
jgi:hypothetical protein